MSGIAIGEDDYMQTKAPNLSKEKMNQLLAAIGREPAEDTTQIEAAEYDWRQPHYFTSVQLKRLDDFTKRIGKTIAYKFSTLSPGEFNVKVDSVTQLFADKVLDEALDTKQNDYYMAFGHSQERLCGLIGVPTQSALVWATQLLGDTSIEQDSNRDLSQLEESLLLDTACAIVEGLAGAHSRSVFLPTKNLVRRLLPLELQGAEELCKITFSVQKADSEKTRAYLLILSDNLVPIVGKAAQDTGSFSAEDFSNAVLTHLQQVSLSVTGQLATTELALKELMNLGCGDILLLDKRVDEPIELVVEGRAVFCGQPAKSNGKYAVVITAIPGDTTGNSAPMKPSHNTTQTKDRTRDTK
ncbi:MAG: FliM/FliN family flagellar motor switch protein [Planctomycetota bacterium]|jgi:flagellar motor switch protein FliM